MTMTKNRKANTGAAKGKADGYAFFVPEGTAVPTDFESALADGAMNLGFVSEDGITDSPEFETEDHKDGNGDVVESTQSGYAKKVTMTPIEHKADTLRVIYGEGNVTDAGGKLTAHNKGIYGMSGALVLDLVMRGTRAVRRVYPCVQLTEVGESTAVTGDLFATEVTFTVYQDEATGDYDVTYYASTETEA